MLALAVASDISVCDTAAVIAPWSKTIRDARRADPFWTQKKLALEAGVNPETVHRAERGENLELATLQKIARALKEKTGRDVLGQSIAEHARGDGAPAAKDHAGAADELGALDDISILEALASTMTEDIRAHLTERDVRDLLHTYLGLSEKRRQEARDAVHQIAGGLSPRPRLLKKVRG